MNMFPFLVTSSTATTLSYGNEGFVLLVVVRKPGRRLGVIGPAIPCKSPHSPKKFPATSPKKFAILNGNAVDLANGSGRVMGQNGSIIKKACFGSGRNGSGSERVSGRVRVRTGSGSDRVSFFFPS
ncbi:hypothetical protein Hanom_Chr14g01291691 [Helianthus anomalus]